MDSKLNNISDKNVYCVVECCMLSGSSTFGQNDRNSDNFSSCKLLAYTQKLDILLATAPTTVLLIVFLQVVQMFFGSDFNSDPITAPLLQLTSTLLLGSFTEISRDRHQKLIISTVFTTVNDIKYIFTFCRHLLQWVHFQKDVLPLLLNCCQSELLKSSCDIKEVVLMLTEVIISRSMANTSGLDLEGSKGLLFFPKCGTKTGGQILKAFLDNLEIDEDVLVEKERLSLIWVCLVCIPCIRWVVLVTIIQCIVLVVYEVHVDVDSNRNFIINMKNEKKLA